jgi:ketosteroid isomerase-like protein
MNQPAETNPLAQIAAEYFRRADAGQSDVLDLFTDDVEVFFPKFGVSRGKAAFGELASGLLATLQSLAHDQPGLAFISSGTTVVVEGTTRGVTRDGTAWEGGKTPGGRFCSIFEFRGTLISRMYIYLDPDYGSADRARFLWPESASRHW